MSPNDFERFHTQFRQQWLEWLTRPEQRPMDGWFDKKTSSFNNMSYGDTLLDLLQIRPTTEERTLLLDVFLSTEFTGPYYGKDGEVTSQDIYQEFVDGIITQNELDDVLVERIKDIFIMEYEEEIKQVYEAHYATA